MKFHAHTPQYKLGRWDGKVGFRGLGGLGHVNHLDVITSVPYEQGIEIDEIVDLKEKKVDLHFDTINDDFWGDKLGLKGHDSVEGETIRLRDYSKLR